MNKKKLNFDEVTEFNFEGLIGELAKRLPIELSITLYVYFDDKTSMEYSKLVEYIKTHNIDASEFSNLKPYISISFITYQTSVTLGKIIYSQEIDWFDEESDSQDIIGTIADIGLQILETCDKFIHRRRILNEHRLQNSKSIKDIESWVHNADRVLAALKYILRNGDEGYDAIRGIILSFYIDVIRKYTLHKTITTNDYCTKTVDDYDVVVYDTPFIKIFYYDGGLWN